MSTKSLQLVRGRRLIGLVMALILSAMVATGFIWAYKTVNIQADGKQVSIHTLHSDPAAVLTQAGITLGAQDEFRLDSDKLRDGSGIEVYRAKPVTIVYQGKTQTILTAKPTVGEAAAAFGIPQSGVRLSPDPAALTTAGMEIRAVVLSEQMVETQMPAPYPVVRQPDADMEKGSEEVVAAGADGLKHVVVKMRYEDGVHIASDVVSEQITVEPKPQIVKVGTRDTVQTARGNMRFRRVEWMEATAYTPYDGSVYGLTATGIKARHGVVAVDPSIIPLGSRVYIPGYGLALAADTGGAIVGNRIDLCMENHGEAMNFGSRTVKVYLLE